MVRAISIPNFRMIGRIVPEKQGGGEVHPPIPPVFEGVKKPPVSLGLKLSLIISKITRNKILRRKNKHYCLLLGRTLV